MTNQMEIIAIQYATLLAYHMIIDVLYKDLRILSFCDLPLGLQYSEPVYRYRRKYNPS